MIGWIRQLVVDHVLAPQGDPSIPAERRAYVDPESRPLGSEAVELDVLATTTRPLAEEIGGGFALRHELDVGLEVQHGDPAEATRLRDAIVLDLVMRLTDPATLDTFGTGSDPATGQYVTRTGWVVSYAPLVADTPNEYARLTITVETQLDR